MKRLLFSLATSLSLLAASAAAQHEHHGAPTAGAPAAARPTGRPWTAQPLLLPVRQKGLERSQGLLQLQGITAATVTVHAADGPAERLKVDYPVGDDGARIAASARKVGNYHWIVAREESADAVRIASTAWFFGNPGASPKDLLHVPKHELEIVPQPLPREHGYYRESEKWRFLVRFDGRPLAGQALKLETEFGSRSTFVTDASGHATVLFPRDFRPREGKAGDHGRQQAKFVLVAEKESAGRKFLTAFNLVYAPDADRDRSLGWGAAFGLVGMIAATPLLRRRKTPHGATEHA